MEQLQKDNYNNLRKRATGTKVITMHEISLSGFSLEASELLRYIFSGSSGRKSASLLINRKLLKRLQTSLYLSVAVMQIYLGLYLKEEARKKIQKDKSSLLFDKIRNLTINNTPIPLNI